MVINVVFKAIVALAQVRKLKGNEARGVFGGIESAFWPSARALGTGTW